MEIECFDLQYFFVLAVGLFEAIRERGASLPSGAMDFLCLSSRPCPNVFVFFLEQCPDCRIALLLWRLGGRSHVLRFI